MNKIFVFTLHKIDKYTELLNKNVQLYKPVKSCSMIKDITTGLNDQLDAMNYNE